ncbi:GntR family transcriptional regulator [Streptacidiphilus sp. ASG 303]|uniref:GntR family transcriptional regulator n=1 Tax=Streptacidiphilus sp. ASG 303 TaxID=2896847 RepID=UPI001E4B42D2|nr:GntR family transcriptional regulator [Streptacidiphilus sp. ASG 303]MCD0483579.1 GntR family transcriptional regulator [Streptacidiphilus sp. ASG 303]
MTDLSHAPRYVQIEHALRRRIARASAGDALPSESELCREFGASRMTVRAAMARLVDEGLVHRQAGRGSFVAEAPPARRADLLVGFGAEMRRQGRVPGSREVAVRLRRAAEEEAHRLRLGREASVVSVRRVRVADGVPIAWEHAVFPGALSGLAETDLVHGSLHEALVKLGFVPTAGRSWITAAVADEERARVLEVPPGSALLVEERVIDDQDGTPLEFTRSAYAADRYRLSVGFHVDRPGSGRAPA